MCNQNNQEGGHKCCGWWSSHRHNLLRIFFWVLVVLGFVFTFSVGIEVARSLRERKDAIRYARAGYHVEKAAGGYKILPRLVYTYRTEQKPVMVFGKILKVETNKITILNNGAAEQIVISLPETKISLAGKDAGISDLKADQEGFFSGMINKDGALEARMVELK